MQTLQLSIEECEMLIGGYHLLYSGKQDNSPIMAKFLNLLQQAQSQGFIVAEFDSQELDDIVSAIGHLSWLHARSIKPFGWKKKAQKVAALHNKVIYFKEAEENIIAKQREERSRARAEQTIPYLLTIVKSVRNFIPEYIEYKKQEKDIFTEFPKSSTGLSSDDLTLISNALKYSKEQLIMQKGDSLTIRALGTFHEIVSSALAQPTGIYYPPASFLFFNMIISCLDLYQVLLSFWSENVFHNTKAK